MKIKESAIRDYLRESLFGHSEPGVINVNPVVDPQASLTDPMNTNFKPQNDVELKIAINNLIKSSNLQPEEIFDNIKNNLSNEEQKKMKKPAKDNQLESKVRDVVRTIISEITLEQIPPAMRKNYLDAGAPETGEIPQKIIDRVNDALFGEKTGKKKTRTTKDWFEANKKSLQSTMATMKLDPDPVSDKTLKSLTNKIKDITHSLIIAVLKKIIDDFKKMVADYNKTLKQDERFNLASISGFSSFVRQYLKFMSHVSSNASDADWKLIQSELEKLHTKIMDPTYLLYSGEKISNLKVYDQFKKVEQPLRGWLNDVGREIKEFEELRDVEGTSKRVNINKATFMKPVEDYFAKTLKMSPKDTQEILQVLGDAMADESAANMTNILSQKMVIAAFIAEWDNQVLENEVINGIKLKDLFAEKQASRVGSFAQSALGYATTKATDNKKNLEVQDTGMSFKDTVSTLITLAVYALENEMDTKTLLKVLNQKFTKQQLDSVVDNNEFQLGLIEDLTKPGMNKEFDSANFSREEVFNLIVDAMVEGNFGTVGNDE